MKLANFILLSQFFLYVVPLKSQISLSENTLPDVWVIEKKNWFEKEVNKSDSSLIQQHQNRSVSSLLAAHVPVFVREYGAARLATITIRGTNANQTAVVWNDFTLQNPTNGITDLSLLPVYFFDEININTSSEGGTIGGMLSINNRSIQQEDWKTGLSYNEASFGNYFGGLKVSYKRKSFSVATKAFCQAGKNDYSYYNIDNKKLSLSNAKVKNNGIIQDYNFRLKNNEQLSLRFWYQDAEREIPPTATNDISVAIQEDNILRTSLDWKKTLGNHVLRWQTGFFRDKLHYRDSLSGIDSQSKSVSLHNKAKIDIALGDNIILKGGLEHIFSTAEVDNYAFKPHRHQSTVFAKYTYHSSTAAWKMYIELRQTLIDAQERAPFAFNAKSIYHITKNVSLGINTSKNYRLPTFNDLYWDQGGNPNLKAEKNWSEELSNFYYYGKKNNKGKGGVTFFNKNTKNQIVWVPISGGIFSPQNIQKVWSRGIEISWQQHLKLGAVRFVFDTKYSYVKATNVSKQTQNDRSVDKQLIYTPLHQGLLSVRVYVKNYSFSYQYTVKGKSYTLSDNSAYLSGVQLSNLYVSRHFKRKQWQLEVFIRINNIFNRRYQVVQNVPMPGRFLQVGIDFDLSPRQKNKK